MGASLAERFADLQPAQREKLLAGLTDDQLEGLLFDWGFWARPEQIMPPGDWDTWLIMTGRGWGKTRSGGEGIRQWEEEGYKRFILVARTVPDMRKVMITGESGLLSLYPDRDRPRYEPSKTMVTWPRRGTRKWAAQKTSATAELFTADEPDQMRGPQAEKIWIDEPATWRRGMEAYDNLMYGARLGDKPQIIATTTPRPVALIRMLVKDPGTLIQTGSLLENVDNLAPSFRKRIMDRYEGTRLGRQEIEGVLLEDTPGALWKRPWIDDKRWKWDTYKEATKHRIVVGVDPSGSESEESDEAGVGVAADVGGEYAVIEDRSGIMSPSAWAGAAIDLYLEHAADLIVAEKNYGGLMVEETIRNVAVARGISVPPIKLIHAKRGKVLRAQPVATLYEQGRVHHVGSNMAELEDQQCNFDPLNMPDHDDRVDWCVYALIELSGVEPLDGPLMS